MIGKVLRGKRVQGLIRYLYGPGRHGEHRDPHIVAGFRSPADLEPSMTTDGSRDFRRLDGLLTQPLALLGDRNYHKPVWHLSVRSAPDDPVLTDQQWAEIAGEMMSRTGLAPDGDLDAVRWIAVRHAHDHVHIVATLARTDGTRPEVWNDGYRVRDACRAVEERYGLRRTAPADRTASRRPKRGEQEKAMRVGRDEPVRSTLRRRVATAAAGARTEDEFFTALREDGVLVRLRFSARTAGQVTGYAVALPDDLAPSGGPIWFGGGKLAGDLTLPSLRRRWTPRPVSRSLSGQNLSARTIRAVLRTTVRRVADEAQTVDDFLRRLGEEGFLVRSRFSQTRPDQVTGYAVALPDDQGGDEGAVWFSGGRLADDLTLPRLCRRWSTTSAGKSSSASTDDGLTAEERQAFYDDAARAAAFATAQIRRHMATAPHAAQDACWAASDVLHVAAKATGNRHLRRAADSYERAARAPWGRITRPSPAGNTLRGAARLLKLAGAHDRNTLSILLLVSHLLALLDTVANLRQLQQRQAQAEAARRAARHLSPLVAGPDRHRAPWLGSAAEVPSSFQPAQHDFPAPWAPAPFGGGAPPQPRTTPARPRTVKHSPPR